MENITEKSADQKEKAGAKIEWSPVTMSTFTIQFLKLRLRDHCGRGVLTIVRAKIIRNLLWNSIY